MKSKNNDFDNPSTMIVIQVKSKNWVFIAKLKSIIKA